MFHNFSFFFSIIQMYRRYCQLQGVDAKDIQINPSFQAFTLHFSDFTNILGTLITIGHVWASDGSALSLSLGIFLSLCDLAVLSIFNHQLLSTSSNTKSLTDEQERHKQLRLALYIMSSITCILGSKVGSFIVHFAGTVILGAALGLSSPLTLSAAILIASVTTVSGLLFSTIQACDLWEKTSTLPTIVEKTTIQPSNKSPFYQPEKKQASNHRSKHGSIHFFPKPSFKKINVDAEQNFLDRYQSTPMFETDLLINPKTARIF